MTVKLKIAGILPYSEILGNVTEMPWGEIFAQVDEMPRHPAQLYEALCYLATFVVLILLYRYTSAPRRRGLLFGLGMIGIFLTRFFIEFIKENQVAFESDMTLNMGQWLSVPFILAGTAIMIWAWFHHSDEEMAPHAASEVKSPKNKRHFKK